MCGRTGNVCISRDIRKKIMGRKEIKTDKKLIVNYIKIIG